MFEDRTYETLMERALGRVPPTLDKREGSMVFNGVAPSMAEVAQLYLDLEFVLRATYLSTAPREYLIKRAADRNLAPYPASPAVFRAECNMEVPVGTRFSCEDLNFVVTGRTGEYGTEDTVSHKVACETAGSLANHYAGRLIPVEYIDGLARAELVELLVPGEDEEETEAFRQRVLDSLQSQAFGGNQADYREKVLAMPGVGAVKVYPAWNRGLNPESLVPGAAVGSWVEAAAGLPPAVQDWLAGVYTAAKERLLTVGGVVKVVVLASNFTAPSGELVRSVQEALDPQAGEGLGLAPIGHVVKVEGVKEESVDVALHLAFLPGWGWEAARSYIEEVLDGYFLELAQEWAGTGRLVVRVSQIESRILSQCREMVADIGGTQLDGKEENLVLGPDSIPVRGDVRG